MLLPFVLHRVIPKMQNKISKSGGKPPFPTCEARLLESLRQRHLSGQEGWLAPALAWINFYLDWSWIGLAIRYKFRLAVGLGSAMLVSCSPNVLP